MPPAQSIRIIKRKQRELLAAPQSTLECELKTESQTRRDIFATITSWIEEQRETKQALHQHHQSLLRPLTG
jgi:hypothetical protein